MQQKKQQERLRSIDIISLLSPRLAWRLVRGITRSAFDENFAGAPLAVCWFTNFSCNARCHFCCKAAEIRAGRDRFPPLPLDKAKRLMAKIREKVGLLYLSGGEPTIHPHIIDILKEAKSLNFDSVGISSNLIALDKNIEILEFIDAIGASIHSPDVEVHARNLGVPVKLAEKVFDNLRALKEYSGRNGIKVLINCVINPANMHTVMDMVRFTAENGFLLELVPANDCGRMPAELSDNPNYKALLGDLKPFRCFPYGVPNIMPDGRLCTPCDVSQQYAVNVLDHKHIKDAVKASLPFLGDYPCKNGQCFKAGIVERSRLFGLLADGKNLDVI
jgi:MoaA/NifB/PqqE/SkfB family radical SAM enzyme